LLPAQCPSDSRMSRKHCHTFLAVFFPQLRLYALSNLIEKWPLWRTPGPPGEIVRRSRRQHNVMQWTRRFHSIFSRKVLSRNIWTINPQCGMNTSFRFSLSCSEKPHSCSFIYFCKQNFKMWPIFLGRSV
jgi:hypothetical protein